ncbi:MAG: hypothetical protein MZV63_04315 [Marinilabiliales bacterium]|nr:hypothetical protein [Marinilabiliales bacterium]
MTLLLASGKKPDPILPNKWLHQRTVNLFVYDEPAINEFNDKYPIVEIFQKAWT